MTGNKFFLKCPIHSRNDTLFMDGTGQISCFQFCYELAFMATSAMNLIRLPLNPHICNTKIKYI